MGKVYIGQTKLKLEVFLNTDITGATAILKYKKPNNTTGNFPLTITNATTGTAEYEAQNATDFDVVGTWVFWAYVTYGDGKIASGEPFKVHFYSEGK